jgi:hypothetical protein
LVHPVPSELSGYHWSPYHNSFPLGISDTWSGDDEVLDGGWGVRLLSNHDPGRKRETVERHWLNTIFNKPATGQVRPKAFRTADEYDVGVMANRRIGREDWSAYVFAWVVTACVSTRPLESNREVGIGGGDINDLTDTVHGTRLERNVSDTGLCETLDDLSGLLHRWNTKSFDGKALVTHFSPERKLEGELTGVDVEDIQGDTDTSRNIGLNPCDFGTECCGTVVTSPG